MNQYPLTEEHIRFYEENGYIQVDNVLDNTEVRFFAKLWLKPSRTRTNTTSTWAPERMKGTQRYSCRW